MSSRDSYFFIYPRDTKGNFTGHVYCIMLVDGRIYEGHALCSSKDQFDKTIGKTIAYNRAKEAANKNKVSE